MAVKAAAAAGFDHPPWGAISKSAFYRLKAIADERTDYKDDKDPSYSGLESFRLALLAKGHAIPPVVTPVTSKQMEQWISFGHELGVTRRAYWLKQINDGAFGGDKAVIETEPELPVSIDGDSMEIIPRNAGALRSADGKRRGSGSDRPDKTPHESTPALRGKRQGPPRVGKTR